MPIAILPLFLQLAAAPPPLVIGHRGASGYRPEHTLESYDLAIAQGADFVEPDLVSTKDGVLVCRHEPEIGATTDAATRFPRRKRTVVVEGDTVEGWWIQDFTLAELKTLRARERVSSRSHQYDGYFTVPTFEEVLQLVSRRRVELARRIGVYPEVKHPEFFRALGLDLERPLLEALTKYGYGENRDPVFIQSFDSLALKRLRPRTRLQLVLLLGAEAPVPDLAGVSRYADAIGVDKRLVLAEKGDGSLAAPSTLVADAHAHHLAVHAWTFRADAPFLPKAWRGDAPAELRRFAELGVDAVFTDFPDVAVRTYRGRAPSDPPPSRDVTPTSRPQVP